MAVPQEVLRTAKMSHFSVPLPGEFQGTAAERDAAVIKRVLEVLEYNQMIQFTSSENWPEWVELDPVI